MSPLRQAFFAGVYIVPLLLIGCGGDGMAEVSGTVTLDRTPIDGAIKFEPADGKTAVTGGPINKGSYSVRVPSGKMKVSISMPKVVGKKKLYPTPDSPVMDVTVEGLRSEYNEKTTLILEVGGGTIKKDYELTSR